MPVKTERLTGMTDYETARQSLCLHKALATAAKRAQTCGACFALLFCCDTCLDQRCHNDRNDDCGHKHLGNTVCEYNAEYHTEYFFNGDAVRLSVGIPEDYKDGSHDKAGVG